MLQTFNTVGQHGIDRDGSYSGGSGIFAISFLREVLPANCLVSLSFNVTVSTCEMMAWCSYNGVSHVNTVTLRRAWLVLKWMTAGNGYTILVCIQPLKPTWDGATMRPRDSDSAVHLGRSVVALAM